MSDKLISVIDAANELGMIKQTLFKKIKELGLSTVKQRNSDYKNQMISYMKKADLELVKRDALSRRKQKEGNDDTLPFQVDRGVFYLIRLEPEHDPGRFMTGFTSNMSERLRKHRCSAPFAKIVKTWSCHQLWEKTATDCVTQSCEQISLEVFRTEDISRIKEKCDQFFSLMPDLD